MMFIQMGGISLLCLFLHPLGQLKLPLARYDIMQALADILHFTSFLFKPMLKKIVNLTKFMLSDLNELSEEVHIRNERLPFKVERLCQSGLPPKVCSLI